MSDENAGSDDKMEQIPEDGIDDSNCESGNGDQLSGSLQKISVPSDDADNYDPLEKLSELPAQGADDAYMDNEKAVELPSEGAEPLAEKMVNSDSLTGEN